MKEGWGKFSLMDICNVTTGKHDANHAEENGKYRFYTCSSQYVYCNTKRYEGECIILPGNGVNVGESYYFNGEFDAYQRTYVIDKIDKKIIIPMYLYYHLQNNWKSKGVAKQYGSATNYIKIGNFKDYIVTIPQSLSEQQSIVDYLDSAFAKIDEMKANAEKALGEAKVLFQASLKEMLEPKEGWEEKKIKDIGSVIGGTTPNTNVAEFWDGTLCWISPAELDGSHYLYDSKKKITEAAVKAKSLKLLPEGTVILSSRAPIGKVVINKVPTYCNQGFKCVVCGKEIYNEFLYWWFWGNTQYLNSLGTGATFKEISKKVVEEILIPVPSLPEQQSIVETLDSLKSKVDLLQSNFEKISQECDALKQAILRQVFE